MTQQPRRAAVSLYAEAFATYRRRRAAIALAASADLADLRCAGEAGLASVVLPVYNGARYVAEALESVLQQTYAQFELIVIDDGSTDSTPRVLAEFAARDPRIRVFRQANQKLPAALNRGFREARGEFLTWISADNRFKPAFLDRMTGALRRHPQWDMVYANMDVIGPEGAPVRGGDWYRLYQTPPGSEHLHLPTDTAELNMWGDNYIGAAFLYRRCVPLLIGEYSPWLFGLEDYDYWMRINALLTLRHTDFAEPVYEYRLHAAALTADPALDLARRRARLVAFEDYRRSLYCVPAAWRIECAGGTAARAVAAELCARLRTAGHVLVGSLAALGETPPFFVPAVYARVCDGEAAVGGTGRGKACAAATSTAQGAPPAEPPAALPPHILQVLISAGAPAKASAAAGWDLHACTAAPALSALEEAPCSDWLAVPEPATLLQAIDVRCRAKCTQSLEAEIAAPAAPECEFSVVVGNDCSGGADAVHRALVAQTVGPEAFELIVVEEPAAARGRAQRTPVAPNTEPSAGATPRVRYVRSLLPGRAHTRNAGLAAARGQFVCFLDADVIPTPQWLATLRSIFQDRPRCVASGGAAELDLAHVPRWLRAAAAAFLSPCAPQLPPLGISGSWAFRRLALLAIGGFRPEYGFAEIPGAHEGEFVRTSAGRRADGGDDLWPPGGAERIAAKHLRSLGGEVELTDRVLARRTVPAAALCPTALWRAARSAALVEYRLQRDGCPGLTPFGIPDRAAIADHLRRAFCGPGRWADRVRHAITAAAFWSVLSQCRHAQRW